MQASLSQQLGDLAQNVHCHSECLPADQQVHQWQAQLRDLNSSDIHRCQEMIDRCSDTLSKAWQIARSTSAKAVKDWLLKALPRGASKAYRWLKREEQDYLELFIAPEGVLQLPAPGSSR